jgi:hypothetical protein
MAPKSIKAESTNVVITKAETAPTRRRITVNQALNDWLGISAASLSDIFENEKIPLIEPPSAPKVPSL